jgi:hypothetical protein
VSSTREDGFVNNWRFAAGEPLPDDAAVCAKGGEIVTTGLFCTAVSVARLNGPWLEWTIWY